MDITYQLADLLTNPLPREVVVKMRTLLGTTSYVIPTNRVGEQVGFV